MALSQAELDLKKKDQEAKECQDQLLQNQLQNMQTLTLSMLQQQQQQNAALMSLLEKLDK